MYSIILPEHELVVKNESFSMLIRLTKFQIFWSTDPFRLLSDGAEIAKEEEEEASSKTEEREIHQQFGTRGTKEW